jgi:hypothetical protein
VAVPYCYGGAKATVFHVEKMKNAETTAKLEFFTSLARKFYLHL